MCTDDTKYWSYALRFYSTSILSALVTNICLLTFAVKFFVDGNSYSSSSGYYVVVAIESVKWLVLNSLSLAVYSTILLFGEEGLIRHVKYSSSQIWSYTGNLILATRVYDLVTILLDQAESETNQCYSLPAPNQQYLIFPLCSFILDLSQMTIITTLMFPLPFNYLYSILEILRSLIRVYTCFSWIVEIKGLVYVPYFFVGNIILLAAVISYAAYYFEFYGKKLYYANEQERLLALKKKSFVELLCKESTIPIQLIRNVIENIDVVQLNYFGKNNIRKLLRSCQEIKISTDDLLLLLRFEEGRYYFTPKDRVNVESLLSTIVSNIFELDNDSRRPEWF